MRKKSIRLCQTASLPSAPDYTAPKVAGATEELTAAITDGTVGTDADWQDYSDWFEVLGQMIEDNEDVAKYIALSLGEDYQIHHARNGQEGIDQALELIPDIIICDVMMPVKDGYEVCSFLKQDEIYYDFGASPATIH